MCKIVLLSVLFLLFTVPVTGEYYQYKDSQGNQLFTDDIANVPEDQRLNIKTFESVQSEPQQDITNVGESPQENEATEEEAVKEKTGTDEEAQVQTSNTGNPVKADELDTMREELRKTLADLEAERTSIGPPPPANAKSEVKIDYNAKVSELNRKVVIYQQRTKEFDDKVKAYNRQVGKK